MFGDGRKEEREGECGLWYLAERKGRRKARRDIILVYILLYKNGKKYVCLNPYLVIYGNHTVLP